MRSVLHAVLLALPLVWGMAQGALAQQDDVRVARMQDAFDTWLTAQDVRGVGAVAYRGTPAAVLEGGLDPQTPVELASVGKSITALCVAALFDEGALNYVDSPLSLLGEGPAVPIAQLLTHSGGLVEDVTQDAMFGWLDQTGHRAADVADLLGAATNPVTGPRGAYVYNNANYALLALMIERASGQQYEQACRMRVLDPIGVTATPSPRTGAFLSWGGWRMTVADYARFHGHWFGGGAMTGADPFGMPHIALGEGLHYGLGTFFRPFRQRYNFWHHGALCFDDTLNVGAFAVTWAAEWSVVVAYDGCVPIEAMWALDTALSQAALGELP